MTVVRPEDLAKILGVDPKALDTSGLKLTLGEVYTFESRGELRRCARRLPEYKRLEPRNGVYELPPGAYLVRYREVVRIPEDMIAIALPRSSLLRMGVVLYTAVWDPGYRGRGVTLMLVLNPHGVVIEEGAHIAQLVYIRMSGRVSRPYSGVYQGEGLP